MSTGSSIFGSLDWLNPKSKDEVLVPSGKGRGVAKRKHEEAPALEPLEIPLCEPAKEEGEEKRPQVILRNPIWEARGEVFYNEETEISVEAVMPLGHIRTRTRVLFELFAESPEGPPERISQGEGFIRDRDQKAVCRIPVFLPQWKNASSADPDQGVRYFFWAKHSCSELLKGNKESRLVKHESPRVIASYTLPGHLFSTRTSFLLPGHWADLKGLCAQVKDWRVRHPEGKIVVVGHMDKSGEERDLKSLSERRARSVYAFLAQEPGLWDGLYQEEKWGLSSTQWLLRHLGHDTGRIDGLDHPKTRDALREFQGRAALTISGSDDLATREALYRTFMDGYHHLGLKPKDFEDMGGHAYAGCAAFNPVEPKSGPSESNRRVVILLLKSSRHFPLPAPCRSDEAPCKKQCSLAGTRSNPGWCRYFDNLMKRFPESGRRSIRFFDLEGAPIAGARLVETEARKWMVELEDAKGEC
jgi:hypothetical protein